MKNFTALVFLGLTMIAFNAFAAVNVNTATQEQLESLNGIGPAKAKAIIDYRNKNGNFKNVDELDKVPGIGEGILKKIKSEATVSGATTVKAETKKTEPAAKDKKADKDKEVSPTAAEKKAEAKAAKAAKKAEAKEEKSAKAEKKSKDKKTDEPADKKTKKTDTKSDKKSDSVDSKK